MNTTMFHVSGQIALQRTGHIGVPGTAKCLSRTNDRRNISYYTKNQLFIIAIVWAEKSAAAPL